MSRPASLTRRLTLLFVLVSSVVLLGLGWVLQAAVERHFVEMDRAAIESQLDVLERLFARAPDEAGMLDLEASVEAMFARNPQMNLSARTESGQTLLSTSAVRVPVDEQALASRRASSGLLTWREDDVPYRGMARRLQPEIEGMGDIIVSAAINISHHARFMERFNHTLWVFVLIAAVLSGLLGWWAARRGLTPLRTLQRRAARVTASQLDQRLPESRVPRELTALTHELNEMLARLEEAFDRLSAFSSDLAHELRTPVSNLLTQTQVVLSRCRDAESYREALISNAEELDRLSRMIADMLLLAKADHGLELPAVEPVALDEEIAELFDFYDALAEEEGVRLISEGRALIQGNRLMLRRALSNLLSNALRHSRRGGRVGVSIRDRGEEVELTVENEGETIPPDQLPRLFDRFYRGDPARTRDDAAGVGLGLAITRALVRAHRGEIRAQSGDGLTRFVVELPRSARAPAA